MPNPTTDFKEGVPRRVCHVFFLLDTSGSMAGAKIITLNHEMEEIIEILKIFAKKNSDVKLKVAVLEFNSGCRWVTPNGPKDLEENFEYRYLEPDNITDIDTSVGVALKELNSKLSRHEFLDSMTMGPVSMPIIIFMTDGYATDDYTKPLEEIRKNCWFARSTKIGIAIGDDPDVAMISSVVGNSECVIKTDKKTDKLEVLKSLLRRVTVIES